MEHITRNILSHIVQFHSQFFRPQEITPNDHFEFVTWMGAFRIAYSSRTGAQALFYARNVNDLAGERVMAPNDPRGYRIKIKYPERLTIIEIKNRRHDPDARFAEYDRRIQLDCSSLLKRIPDAAQYIPRIQLREAALYPVGKHIYSGHLGYHPTDVDNNGLSEIDVTTRIHTDYGFNSTTPGQMRRLSRRTKALAFVKKLSPVIRLTLPIEETRGEISAIGEFPREQIIPAILEDVQERIDAIYVGSDPAVLQKNSILTMRRLAETAGMQARDILASMSSWRAATREVTGWGAKLMDITGSVLEFVVNKILADPPVSPYIPENWYHVVEAPRHLMTVNSEMNHFMMRPRVAEVVDEFEWLTPDKHRPSFAENQTLKPFDQRQNFQYWLMSHFLAPYCAVVEHHGAFDDFSQMNNMAEVRYVREETNNGLQFVYDARESKLYAWYSPENFHPLKRKLPYDAAKYFKEDMVLVCNLRDYAEPMRAITYAQFSTEMHLSGYTDSRLCLKPPREPTLDAMNIELSNSASANPVSAPHL